MVKLSEVTAQELLTTLEHQLQFDWILDSVSVTFYANRKADSRMITTCYTMSSAGEWLLAKIVKAYEFKTSVFKADNTNIIEIDVVLSML